jgi:hypothetical protein
VNLRTCKLTISTVTRKNARGKEYGIPISVNNVYITELSLEDKLRVKKLMPAQRAGGDAASAKPAQGVATPK